MALRNRELHARNDDALDLQLTGDVDKPSAIGQPTRPTLFFVLLGSINK